jgi:hypothetical protein
VYASQPRAWTPTEVQALGALAVVTAELVRTAVELPNHQVEAAQPRRALASLVWIEQAKGMVAATQGVTLDQAFQQLRVRARSSSRKLAEVAQEIVQNVQQDRVAAKALDDARVQAAEARAQEAEQALQAAETGMARRTAGLDRTRDNLAARERAADQRDHLADERDQAADDRNHVADARDPPPRSATALLTSATATGPPTNAGAPPTSATRLSTTPTSTDSSNLRSGHVRAAVSD